MRKAALQLLTALLQYNPFGGELPEGRFEASLAEWKAKLQVRVRLLRKRTSHKFTAASGMWVHCRLHRWANSMRCLNRQKGM